MSLVYIKIRMCPERFWVEVESDALEVLRSTGQMAHGIVMNNCVDWPFKVGDSIPLTGDVEIVDVQQAPDALDADIIE